MRLVNPKKYLGQHFLMDENIAYKIVKNFKDELSGCTKVLEIGPGTGILTKLLIEEKDLDTIVIEIDHEAVEYLRIHYSGLKIIERDFLKYDLSDCHSGSFAVIGNFPYNISSQILFKVLEYRNQIPLVTGMFQKEVAERIASPPGSKKYGILSVLVQTFYRVKYLFTVNEQVFFPPPKVKSAVIMLKRNNLYKLACDEAMFIKVVKTSFNQRRKILRNALKSMFPKVEVLKSELLTKRAEQLSVDQFVDLTLLLSA